MDDQNPGMDIAPDEEIPNYWQRCELPVSHQATHYLANGLEELQVHDDDDDLQEDHGGVSELSRVRQAQVIGIRTSHRVQEPTDATSDAVPTIYQRVFPTRQQQQHNGTMYYNSEEHRLQTFSDWRYRHVVSKEELARNGFIYTGTADKVRCTFCNVILRQWDDSDVVETEHRKASPRCPMVTGQDSGNIPYTPFSNGLSCAASATPMDAQASSATSECEGKGHDINPLEEHYGSSYAASGRQNGDAHRRDSSSEAMGAESPACEASPRIKHMAILPARLETFKDWPPQMKQKPQQLAEAGLYYTGDGDRTKCFHCAGLLFNWEPQDDPFVEHARWFPNCQYMKIIKGEEFINKCKSGDARNEDVLQTPAVLAILHDGFSVEQVLKAVETLKKNEGVSVVISAQKILETIYKLEDESRNHFAQTQASVPNSSEVEQLQRENESLKDKQLCKVCMERDVEIIFYPCKHFVCCGTCGSGLSECPICRTVISSRDRVYMA